jgi:hypothetical protein
MSENLVIMGLDVSVHFQPMNESESELLFGYWSQGPVPSITVNSSCSESIQARTILHEVLEAVNDLNGIGLTEEQIKALETSLADTFGRNRDFFSRWLARV